MRPNSGCSPYGPRLSRRQTLQSAAGLGIASIAGITSSADASASDGGDVLWSTDVDGELSSPTVIDGTVFLGGKNGLHALDADSGRRLWHWQNDEDVASSPHIVDGTVYVGSRDSNLYALNAETGEQHWQFGAEDEIVSSPTVSEGTVYVGSDDSRVYAVDTETGEKQWQTEEKRGASVQASPVVVDGTVFIKDGDFLRALDAESGEEQWRSDAGVIMTSVTVANGTVYVGGHQVRAVDSESGETVWSALSNQRPEIWFRSTPTVANGRVFIGGGKLTHG